jgi:hypothetical protein
MSPGNRAKLGAYLMVGIVSLMLFVTGSQLPSLVMRVVTAGPLVVTMLFATYDRWIWRWPGIVRLAGRPSLVGTWYGTLTSYRGGVDPQQPIVTTLDIALSISQSLTTTSVTLLTEQSSSRSVTAEFVSRPSEPGAYTLYYTYENTPRLEHRDVLLVHRGTTAATVFGSRPADLEAEYWTNRETKGTFEARRVSGDRARTFQEAQQMAAKSGQSHSSGA